MVTAIRVDRTKLETTGEVVVQVGIRLPRAAGGAVLVIKFKLPPAFPARGAGPIVTIHDTTARQNELLCTHAWIDQYGQLNGHPDVRSWDTHKDLGTVVQAHIHEFTTRPPVVVSTKAAPRATYAARPTETTHVENYRGAQPRPQLRPQSQPRPAAVSAPAMAALRTLRMTELQWLAEGGDGGARHREAFLLAQPECAALAQLRADVRSGAERNAACAAENLALATSTRALHTDVARLEETAAEQAARVDAARTRLAESQAGFTPTRVIVKLMQAADAEADAAKAVYRAFERGGGDVRVSHFCDDYFEARLKYHTLQAKADKLRDMIHLGQQV